MVVKEQLRRLVGVLGNPNLTATEEVIKKALDIYERLARLVCESGELQWQRWPAELGEDLGALCYGRLKVQPSYLTEIAHRLSPALWGWHYAWVQELSRFCDEESPSTSSMSVLTGFNVVNDVLFTIGSSSDFDKLRNVWNISNSVQPRAVKQPRNLDDVFACLLYSTNYPQEENKYYVNDPSLLENIFKGATEIRLPCQRTVGGAAGNTAFILTGLGIDVDLWTPFFSSGLNWNELQGVGYLNLGGRQTEALPSLAPDLLPVKETIGFQFVPSQSRQGSRPSRVLFISADPRSSVVKPWQKVQLVYKRRRKDYPPPESSPNWGNPYIWPYPPLFCHVSLRRHILEIHPFSPAEIKINLVRKNYAVAIVKELGYKEGPSLLAEARVEQIRCLQKELELPFHVELSANSNLGLLRHTLSKGPWSCSLNQDDLVKITSNYRSIEQDSYNKCSVAPFLFPKRVAEETLFERFLRAKHLLEILQAQWVYVHGNELDIIVWKNNQGKKSSPGKRLRDSMLLAKAAVVAAMITRAVPQALHPLITNLLHQQSFAPKGIWALFEFVNDFASWISMRRSVPKNLIWNCFIPSRFPPQSDYGWYEDDDFGVAVAPVFWPDVAAFLNATGAGDYSSAVVATCAWS